MTRANTALYVYCIVRSAKRPPLARVPAGLPGAARPSLHALERSLWLAVADVPLDVYGPSHLEPRLRDLDWVSQAAVAHEAVVEHFSKRRGAAVIPMKLFTLFSSLDRAVADVSARRAVIDRTMRRIAGAEEWGVRIFRLPQVQNDAPPRPISGADFLRARRDAREAAVSLHSAAADAGDRAFDRLRRVAREARVRDARNEPGSNPPILDAAFLVAVSGRARFRAEAKRQAAALAAAGAELSLTGPWPAYNFVAGGAEA